MLNVTLPGGNHYTTGSDTVLVYGDGTVAGANGNYGIEIENVSGKSSISVGHGQDTLNLWGSGTITQLGAKGMDTIYLGHGSDTIKEAGTAVFHTSTGCATVIGGTFEFSNLPGSKAAEYVALSGHQTLLGVNGPTEFVAGKGSTSMVGGNGNDTFVGGTGSDTSTGGTANNLFEYLGGGKHVITNFVSGQDSLYIEGHSFNYLKSHGDISTSGGNTYISLDGGKTTIELQGFSGSLKNDITTHKP